MRYVHLRPVRNVVTGETSTCGFVFEAENEIEYDAAIALIDAFCEESFDASKGGHS